MRFMVLVYPGNRNGYEAGQMPEPQLIERMGKFNEELVNAGVMQAGDGLHPSQKGARVHFGACDKTVVTYGPFREEMLLGGFWMWNVKNKEEAITWAKRAPMEENATLELRQVFESADFGPDVERQENELKKKMEEQRR